MTSISHLLFSDQGPIKYKVHPLVPVTILDHFNRRKEGQNRIIGTLVGEPREGYVEIKSCFPVPFTDAHNRFEVDIEYHHTMFELHKKVNKFDVIVGWYASGADVSEDDLVIHDFYNKNVVKNPLFLLVDTSLKTGKLTMKAYISRLVQINDTVLGSQFKRVEFGYLTHSSELLGVNYILKARKQQEEGKEPTPIGQELVVLEDTLKKLLFYLNDIGVYVAKVLKGEVKENKKVGRLLLDALASVHNAEVFEKVYNDNIQDLLMVVYLSKLTQTQIAIAEELQNKLY